MLKVLPFNTFLDDSSHFRVAANANKNNLTMGFDDPPHPCVQ